MEVLGFGGLNGNYRKVQGFCEMGQSEKAKTERAKVQLSKNACNGKPTSSFSSLRPPISTICFWVKAWPTIATKMARF